jgi:predicted nucleotidyltransferase
MNLRELLHQKREAILQIAARHDAHNVRVFGSVARGDAGPDSDIDLLVERGPAPSSWFPAGLVLDLEEFLGCPVEVVTEKGLNPYLRERVLREAIPL